MVSAASPHSQYITDPLLQPFLAPAFDSTAYLNRYLPDLSLTATSQRHIQPRVPSIRSKHPLTLTELASQTQTHTAHLSAQTSRLSDALIRLTDDILRSGSRLAYEVEILRGESISLSETLTEGVQADITRFVTPDLSIVDNPAHNDLDGSHNLASQSAPAQVNRTSGSIDPSSLPKNSVEPLPVISLRTLHHVRANLQSVIATFDAALNWPLPPSTLSLSSIISVSAPRECRSEEEKGQEASRRLRDEINRLLELGGVEGVLAAEKRVKELRELAGVWKGTTEERARAKFVEGLMKAVADRRREEEAKGVSPEQGGNVTSGTASGEGGFLQRLREEIYIE